MQNLGSGVKEKIKENKGLRLSTIIALPESKREWGPGGCSLLLGWLGMVKRGRVLGGVCNGVGHKKRNMRREDCEKLSLVYYLIAF